MQDKSRSTAPAPPHCCCAQNATLTPVIKLCNYLISSQVPSQAGCRQSPVREEENSILGACAGAFKCICCCLPLDFSPCQLSCGLPQPKEHSLALGQCCRQEPAEAKAHAAVAVPGAASPSQGWGMLSQLAGISCTLTGTLHCQGLSQLRVGSHTAHTGVKLNCWYRVL